jgi:hypothetical protein
MSTNDFDEVRRQEREQIKARREHFGQEGESADPEMTRPVGLAFSGGGIRSATFNLGVLQGLADMKLLTAVDYLSTVSGGGYIGAWFHNVIRRNGPEATTEMLSPEKTPESSNPRIDPISFLRKYSNYLAPRPGLYSADTWTIGAIWLRNVLLNQLILVPALASVLMIPVLFAFLQQTPKTVFGEVGLVNVCLTLLAFLPLLAATLIAASNLDRVVEHEFGTDRSRIAIDAQPEWIPGLIFFASLVLGCGNPGNVAADVYQRLANTVFTRFEIVDRVLHASMYWWLQVPWGMLVGGLLFLFGVLQLQGGFVTCYEAQHKDKFGPSTRARAKAYALVMIAICTAICRRTTGCESRWRRRCCRRLSWRA